MIRDALVDLLGKPLADSRVVVVIDAILGFPGDSSTLVDHLEGLRALGWAGFDIVSLFAGPASLVESRPRSADVILGCGGGNLWGRAWLAGERPGDGARRAARAEGVRRVERRLDDLRPRARPVARSLRRSR